MKTRYRVVSQPFAPLAERAAKRGWTEDDSLWDFVDPGDGQQYETFKSMHFAFIAARKAAKGDVWGSCRIYEQTTDQDNPREHDWEDGQCWEVNPKQRVLGGATYES